MILQIKYFGMLSEAVEKENEDFNFSEKTVEELIASLKNRYVKLEAMNFKVAVNHSIAKLNKELSENDEIALLPPFAGG